MNDRESPALRYTMTPSKASQLWSALSSIYPRWSLNPGDEASIATASRVDAQALRRAMGNFATGVTVITAEGIDGPHG